MNDCLIQNHDKVLEKYGYVISSIYRVKIVRSLSVKPKTPKQISIETGIRLNHVSNILAQLRDEGIVECVNPDRKKGRVYRLTKVGLEIAKLLENDDVDFYKEARNRGNS